MSTMANLGIGFKEPLTPPGVKRDEKITGGPDVVCVTE